MVAVSTALVGPVLFRDFGEQQLTNFKTYKHHILIPAVLGDTYRIGRRSVLAERILKLYANKCDYQFVRDLFYVFVIKKKRI